MTNVKLEYQQEVAQLIKTKPLSYFSLLRKKRFAYLLDFIYASTKFLDDSTSSNKLSIRAYCAANGIEDFPRCDKCNSKLDEDSFINGIYGFRSACPICLNAINNEKRIIGRANSTIAKRKQQILDIVESKENLLEKIIKFQKTIPKSDFLICIRYSDVLADIRKQIVQATPLLDKAHSFAERIYWIQNKITSFPLCQQCGKLLDASNNFISLQEGYRQFCCISCMEQNVAIQEKKKKTCLCNYGCECWLQSEEFLQQQIKNNNEKYGVDWFIQSDEFKAKSKKTMLKRYGVEYPLQSDVIKAKFIRTVQQFSDEKKQQIKEAQISTCKENHNVDFPMQSEAVRAKAIETTKKFFGVNYPLQSDVLKRKAIKTCLKNNGVEHPLQNEAIRKKQQESMPNGYKYNGIHFDSKPELAFYIYLEDQNIKFVFQPDLNLKYIGHDNNEHIYFPDFLLVESNQIVEIKGDHFFDKDGNPISPYTSKSWKDKYDFMISNGVLVFKEQQYSKFLKYCEDKFNDKKWYLKYKIKK